MCIKNSTTVVSEVLMDIADNKLITMRFSSSMEGTSEIVI